MAESIKDKVAIIGMGCTRWGERWDANLSDMIVEATDEACADAKIEVKDIQAAWFGTYQSAYTGQPVAGALQLPYLPVTRVENACATGAETFRGASFALISKAYDLVLAVGAEKLKDYGYGGLGPAYPGVWHPLYGASVELGGGPGRYALAATRYFHRYGISPQEGKGALAKISVKSHYCGARNPKAHLHREVSMEQVLNAPMIAWPLGLFDCCGVTDGAAAAILCRAEDAKKYKPSGDYCLIKGFGIAIGPGWGKEDTRYDFTHWEETERAAAQAYEMAGIKDPRKELDMAEVHDCFSISELMCYEGLGLSEKGHAKEDIDAGTFFPAGQPRLRELLGEKDSEKPLPLEGTLPVNISGGLKSFGHPIGASGCREVKEIYDQILGKAQEPSRQLKNVRLGVTHNQGGHPGIFMCGMTVVGAA